MEAILNTIHQTYEGSRVEKYWNGFLKAWFSFEIASFEGKVHFFIRTPRFFKNLVEAQIYAQYPEVEIIEADDYTKMLPDDMPNDDWNLWGAEFGLTKEDAYPIKTYADFNLESASEEEEKIDPMASMMEFMGSIKEGEHIWAQFLIKASDDSWIKEGQKLKDEMLNKTEGKGDDERAVRLSPGDTDVLKALDRNMSKLGFDTGIRIIYLARRDKFNSINIASIIGVMKQYNTQNLNGFKPANSTAGGFWFRKQREYRNQKMMINAYRRRGYFYPPFTKKSFVLTSDELATVYHYPGMAVGTPTLDRSETRKGSPPVNLPT